MYRTRVSLSQVNNVIKLFQSIYSFKSDFGLQTLLSRTLAPLGDRVLIRRGAKETTTAGGIILPTNSATKNNEGEVISVGPGQVDVSGNLHKIELQTGDKVLLPEYGGTPVTGVGNDDEELVLFRADDILGKFSSQMTKLA